MLDSMIMTTSLDSTLKVFITHLDINLPKYKFDRSEKNIFKMNLTDKNFAITQMEHSELVIFSKFNLFYFIQSTTLLIINKDFKLLGRFNRKNMPPAQTQFRRDHTKSFVQ